MAETKLDLMKTTLTFLIDQLKVCADFIYLYESDANCYFCSRMIG